MNIRITEDFSALVADDETVDLSTGAKEEMLPISASIAKKMYEAVRPYVVYLAGVEIFRSASKVPDRVKMLVQRGIPVEAFIIVDTREKK